MSKPEGEKSRQELADWIGVMIDTRSGPPELGLAMALSEASWRRIIASLRIADDAVRAAAISAPSEIAPTREQIIDGDPVAVPRKLVDFLLGISSLEGTDFGETHPTRAGKFWWRTLLGQCSGPVASTPSAIERRQYTPLHDFITAQEELSPEYRDALYRNLWGLYSTTMCPPSQAKCKCEWKDECEEAGECLRAMQVKP